MEILKLILDSKTGYLEGEFMTSLFRLRLKIMKDSTGSRRFLLKEMEGWLEEALDNIKKANCQP
jgi:hypothetical protein